MLLARGGGSSGEGWPVVVRVRLGRRSARRIRYALVGSCAARALVEAWRGPGARAQRGSARGPEAGRITGPG
ncbi:hypothetical protein [Nostocoides sp. F2B08]|uniref:hypothetical protein n=1 Tax=Nostocoides sp. F2B08 TaxID=2653936 RepID=UPI001D054EE9|nr:hypothetical protein [Tetrasphaera sp. F2B08]